MQSEPQIINGDIKEKKSTNKMRTYLYVISLPVPLAPLNVTASAVGTDSINITWLPDPASYQASFVFDILVFFYISYMHLFLHETTGGFVCPN